MERFPTFFLLMLLIVFWCLMSCNATASEIKSQIKIDESALLALKAHITFDPQNILKQNWTSGTFVCGWIGVTCDSRYSRVTRLDISYMSLTGNIPVEIGNLSSLISLDLSENSFHGHIPLSIFNMSSLEYIYLFSNSLSGPLPKDICKHDSLQKLRGLHLSGNNLVGDIPLSFYQCPQLESIAFSSNHFGGHVPREIGNITLLRYFSVDSNNLYGVIPKEVGLLNNLEILKLDYNKLSGELPRQLWNITSLLALSLDDNSFIGNIPKEIAFLNHLDTLAMSYNKFTGPLPRQLWNITTLHLCVLSNNFLTGRIPFNDIGKQSNMTDLSLSSNEFRGELPSNIGNLSNMIGLDLSSNKFSGELPSTICNLTSLEYLVLSSNSFEGIIPQCIGNLSKSIQFLHAQENHFTGLIPSSFTKGCSLVSINLNGNKLEGALPKSLINCQTLKGFDIGNNRVQDKFPFWMETLPHLRILVLRSNRFHGTMASLPSRTKFPFPKLQVLDISRNAFIGSLPERYLVNFRAMIDVKEKAIDPYDFFVVYVEMIITLKGVDRLLERLLEGFTNIDLSCNRFSGRIPHSIGILNSLKYLNLSHNDLIGNIPPSLGNISRLESLDLSVNRLDGEIPSEFTRLTFLSKLNLSMNNLVGQIPQSTQLSTFNNDSYLGNSGLCGLPLTSKCNEKNEKPVQPQEDGDSDFMDGFTWQSVALGYSCGFVVGIGIGYHIIRYGWPKWFVEFFFGAGYNKRKRSC